MHSWLTRIHCKMMLKNCLIRNTVSTTLQRHIKRLEIARNNGVELKYEKI